MSKVVTIPNSSSPFVVIVNGEEYIYPSGETVEVPDHVAEVIENHNDLQPEPGPDTSKPSWNDLRDKPFGEVAGPLTWDGNTEGLNSFMGTVYRVSDAVPTVVDFANGGKLIFSDGQSIEFKSDELELIEYGGGAGYAGGPTLVSGPDMSFMVIPELPDVDEAPPQLSGLTAGVYFYNGTEYGGQYLSSLEIYGYSGFNTVKRMDEKFMPLLTSPSGKKFVLSVDDDGNVTATEA